MDPEESDSSVNESEDGDRNKRGRRRKSFSRPLGSPNPIMEKLAKNNELHANLCQRVVMLTKQCHRLTTNNSVLSTDIAGLSLQFKEEIKL